MGTFSWGGFVASFVLGYGITILCFYISAKGHKNKFALLRGSEIGIIVMTILMVFGELMNSLGPTGAQGVGGVFFIIIFPICVLLIIPAFPLGILTSESSRLWVRLVGAIGVLMLSSVIIYGASFVWMSWVFPNPNANSISACDSLGQTHAQDMTNIDGALKNIAGNYRLNTSNGILTLLSYTCTVGAIRDIQRVYEIYFPITSTDGMVYTLGDKDKTAPLSIATPPVTQELAVDEPTWTIGSSEVINQFMSTGGSEYFKTALDNYSSGDTFTLQAALYAVNGVPIWNISIQNSSLNKSYNAKTGVLCSNTNCSEN